MLNPFSIFPLYQGYSEKLTTVQFLRNGFLRSLWVVLTNYGFKPWQQNMLNLPPLRAPTIIYIYFFFLYFKFQSWYRVSLYYHYLHAIISCHNLIFYCFNFHYQDRTSPTSDVCRNVCLQNLVACVVGWSVWPKLGGTGPQLAVGSIAFPLGPGRVCWAPR